MAIKEKRKKRDLLIIIYWCKCKYVSTSSLLAPSTSWWIFCSSCPTAYYSIYGPSRGWFDTLDSSDVAGAFCLCGCWGKFYSWWRIFWMCPVFLLTTHKTTVKSSFRLTSWVWICCWSWAFMFLISSISPYYALTWSLRVLMVQLVHKHESLIRRHMVWILRTL